MFTEQPKKICKTEMLKRLQFSKNYPIAVKVARLLAGEINETEIHGMFLDAVCRDNFEEAWMRADDHNKKALQARNWMVGKFKCYSFTLNGNTIRDDY